MWQNRRLDQHAPAWDPSSRHSPNTLFAAAAARDGICIEIPPPELYYELLPVHFVKVDARRGVKVGGLWYGARSTELDPCRGVPAPRGGRHAGKWAVRRDPRDCRQVFIELDGTWQALPWNALPEGDSVPAFGDARVREVLKEAARVGLRPRTDAELLPVLLDLLAAVTPVESWPGRSETRKKATARARELARARASLKDRPAPQPPRAPVDSPAPDRDVAEAITADRARRRQAAARGAPPVPAPPLGDDVRSRLLYPAAQPSPDHDTEETMRGCAQVEEGTTG
ncbi:hypothetical protein [Streptomyces sp. NPDC053726]|uniref:hypothetical protein n=1 Tax=Streptomyces sp. NPDC053726 TaxID=3365713 RepID=UPI0037CD51A7